MSAFVVEDDTINRILTWLYHETQSSNGLTYGRVERVLRGVGHEAHHILKLQLLGKAMFDLNVRAVRERYDDADKSGMIPADFNFQFVQTNPIVSLKSLHCWHYQCCEGTVPEDSLYKAFETISQDLATGIVRALPEYEKAPWG